MLASTAWLCSCGSRLAEVGRRQDQALYLLLRHVARQRLGLLAIAQPGHALGAAQRLDIEEPEGGERGIGRGRAEPPVDQLQNPVAQLLAIKISRRGPVVLGQPLDLE